MSVHELTFGSGELRIAATHHDAESDALSGPAGRPCVVLAHGFAATRDSGLAGFAKAFAAAGADALVFEHRGFGLSDGTPQRVDPAGQRADHLAAIAHARTLPGVDPDRIVAWGVSFAGGNVFPVAAQDARLAAVIALTPQTDGTATLVSTLKREGPVAGLKLTLAGLKDVAAAARDRPRVMVPVVGAPGTLAALTAPGASEGMYATAGPAWRNEVCADVFLKIGLDRPGKLAGQLRCPVLVQVADADQTVPPASCMWAAKKARAEVRHLPCDHFDVYPGGPQHERAVAQQVAFLRRHLAVA